VLRLPCYSFADRAQSGVDHREAPWLRRRSFQLRTRANRTPRATRRRYARFFFRAM